MDFNNIKYGISGGLAGITVDLIYYPLQTIKTRIMGSTKIQNLVKNAQQISKFKGFSCQMIVSFPYSFTFFYIYHNIRKNLEKGYLSNVIAASFSQAGANILRNPLQLVKQQLMVGRSNSITTSLTSIYKQKGIRGFYTGYSPTLIRDIAFSTIQMPIYQFLKNPISKFFNSEAQNPFICSISGSIAALISAFLTCPLDVIKTRHMTKIITKQKVTMIETCNQIYKQFGINGYFKGVKTRCFILSFGGIVYFYSFGTMKRIFNVQNL